MSVSTEGFESSTMSSASISPTTGVNYTDSGGGPTEILSTRTYQKLYEECMAKLDNLPTPDYPVYCPNHFDEWGCWEDTPNGTVAIISCPQIDGFDTSKFAYKECMPNGTWWTHPETQHMWADYTNCHLDEEWGEEMVAVSKFITVGYAISFIAVIGALFIFIYFKALHCQRNTIHLHLLMTFAMSCTAHIIWFPWMIHMRETAVYPEACKFVYVLTLYFQCSTYFWMLCEGLYLHTLIVVAVFSVKKNLLLYYLLGWGTPCVLILIYVILRLTIHAVDETIACWVTVDVISYVIVMPECGTLVVNVVFLLNIVRVLVTKLRASNSPEQNQYRKAVRATLILIPLLGMWMFLFFIDPPDESMYVLRMIYKYINGFCLSFQGSFVACIYCYFNGEVIATIKTFYLRQSMIRSLSTKPQLTREQCTSNSPNKILSSSSELKGESPV